MDNKLNEYKRLLDDSGTKFKELVEFAYPDPA